VEEANVVQLKLQEEEASQVENQQVGPYSVTGVLEVVVALVAVFVVAVVASVAVAARVS
jgi:hypothetical protein